MNSRFWAVVTTGDTPKIVASCFGDLDFALTTLHPATNQLLVVLDEYGCDPLAIGGPAEIDYTATDRAWHIRDFLTATEEAWAGGIDDDDL